MNPQEADAYRAFLEHAQACTDCRTDGVDCAKAAELRRTWREAGGRTTRR
jgi:hypothetical protein